MIDYSKIPGDGWTNPFKVGDKVVRMHDRHCGMKVGDLATVTDVFGRSIRLAEYGGMEASHAAYYFRAAIAGVDYDAAPAPASQPTPAYASAPAEGQAGGLKFDKGKRRWSLLMSKQGMLAAVRGVVDVLEFGAKKYAAHSWRQVEDNERRYLDGLQRHLDEILEHGLDARDGETGLLHIDHLNCNGLFLAELARAKGRDADTA